MVFLLWLLSMLNVQSNSLSFVTQCLTHRAYCNFRLERLYCISIEACLFGVFIPIKNFSFIWRCHHYWWRAANFGLYTALMAIEQWGFFSVPHLLWHRASVCGHLWGSTTLTCCRTIGSGAVTTCFQIYHDPESNPDLPHVRQKLYKMSHCGVYNEAISWIFSLIFIHILYILFTRLYTNSFPGKEKKN